MRRADFGDGSTRWGQPRLGPPAGLFVWVPVFLSFVIQVPAALIASARHPEYGATSLLMLVLAIVGPVALVFAKRFPGPVVAITAAAACADIVFTPGSGAPYVALAFAIVSAMARGARVWAFVAVSGGWVLALVGSVAIGMAWHPARIILTTVGVVIVLIIGEAIRTRRDRVSAYQAAFRRRRDEVAQAERERIARELHDVLAHSLSQINVQAGVGLHLIDDHPEKAAEALASIKSTSKTALDEVRGVLGFLRSEGSYDRRARLASDGQAFGAAGAGAGADVGVGAGDGDGAGAEADAPLVPQADLARLPSLIESVSSDALQVTLVNRLTSEPPAGVQLALYRITQESLTNVTRHAHASHARVTLDERADGYELSVIDDGTADRNGTAEHSRSLAGVRAGGLSRAREGVGSGNGLLGMTERAELLGGHLEAGPIASGGFAVVATVPRRVTR